MKPISTALQRKLMYIPIVNTLTIFFALYNIVTMRTPLKVWIKIYPYLLGYTIPSAVFWMVIAYLLPALSGLCSIATMYLTPLLMSCGLILFQEKNLDF